MVKALDIAGEKYGKLTAVSKSTKGVKHTKWLFKCECGVEKDIVLDAVRRGRVTSCGCYMRQCISERSTTHGYTKGARCDKRPKPTTYRSWLSAKARCFNPNEPKYPDYGARGITMCTEWASDFTKFVEHLGERPQGTSLERIDVNGNYEPGNCRWATPLEQARNTRSNVWVETEHGPMILKDFAAYNSVPYKSLSAKMRKLGLSAEEAALILKRQSYGLPFLQATKGSPQLPVSRHLLNVCACRGDGQGQGEDGRQ